MQELISLFEGNDDPLTPDDLIALAKDFLKDCAKINPVEP